MRRMLRPRIVSFGFRSHLHSHLPGTLPTGPKITFLGLFGTMMSVRGAIKARSGTAIDALDRPRPALVDPRTFFSNLPNALCSAAVVLEEV